MLEMLETYCWFGGCMCEVAVVSAKLKDSNLPVIPVWYWRQPADVGLKTCGMVVEISICASLHILSI
jgi:hypothetical protein